MSHPFLEEYENDAAVRRYVSGTAGKGIEHLLVHVYGPLYVESVLKVQDEAAAAEGIRILEFGCGGGMNLIFLLRSLERLGIPVNCAYGTDFSRRMIDAAIGEARKQLSSQMFEKTKFVRAANERLCEELALFGGFPNSCPHEYFHFIFGINTFRYAWRLGEGAKCAGDLYKMLVSNGRAVIVDMNRRFPFFLSKVRQTLTLSKRGSPEELEGDPSENGIGRSRQTALPTLEEYVESLQSAGFEIVRKDTICWIPHSSGSVRLFVWRSLGPVLDKLFHGRAMRALVIARKIAVAKDA